MMFNNGIDVGERYPLSPGEPVLRLHDFTIEDHRMRMKPIRLEVSSGEVIGLGGMEGSGQDLFLRACGGLVRPVGGKVFVKNQNLTGKSYHAFRDRGVAFLP